MVASWRVVVSGAYEAEGDERTRIDSHRARCERRGSGRHGVRRLNARGSSCVLQNGLKPGSLRACAQGRQRESFVRDGGGGRRRRSGAASERYISARRRHVARGLATGVYWDGACFLSFFGGDQRRHHAGTVPGATLSVPHHVPRSSMHALFINYCVLSLFTLNDT